MIIRHIGLILGLVFGIITIYLFSQGDYTNSLISFALTFILAVIELSECYYVAFRRSHPICEQYFPSIEAETNSRGFINSCCNCAFNNSNYAFPGENIINISEQIAGNVRITAEENTEVTVNVEDKATSIISLQ